VGLLINGGMVMAGKEFYLTSKHGCVGSCVMFHAIGGAGYVSDLSKAEVIGFDEAQKWMNYRDGNTPLLKTLVDSLAVRRVDCQYVDVEEMQKFDGSMGYVKVISNRWDGNDILFNSENGETFNYSEAFVYGSMKAGHPYYPVSYLETISRKILRTSDVNERKMVTSAGIRKPKKKRPKSDRVRFNCPFCGKISWQFNPYDFEGCSDRCCEGWAY
jgi:hypothetical protein